MFQTMSERAITMLFVIACAGSSPAFAQAPVSDTVPSGDKVPITSSSDEARRIYVEGRDLLERLRATDARRLFEQAIAKDENFALAYVGLANTAGTN
jgi:Tfp pilus assembly protein PilF